MILSTFFVVRPYGPPVRTGRTASTLTTDYKLVLVGKEETFNRNKGPLLGNNQPVVWMTLLHSPHVSINRLFIPRSIRTHPPRVCPHLYKRPNTEGALLCIRQQAGSNVLRALGALVKSETLR